MPTCATENMGDHERHGSSTIWSKEPLYMVNAVQVLTFGVPSQNGDLCVPAHYACNKFAKLPHALCNPLSSVAPHTITLDPLRHHASLHTQIWLTSLPPRYGSYHALESCDSTEASCATTLTPMKLACSRHGISSSEGL